MKKAVDVIIVGAGHNGLVSAILLARAGLKVMVLEEKDTGWWCCKDRISVYKSAKPWHQYRRLPAWSNASRTNKNPWS